jgi:hypothetical protein
MQYEWQLRISFAVRFTALIDTVPAFFAENPPRSHVALPIGLEIFFQAPCIPTSGIGLTN